MSKNNRFRKLGILAISAVLLGTAPAISSASTVTSISVTPKYVAAADGQLNAPSEEFQQRLLRETLYLLFRGDKGKIVSGESLTTTSSRFKNAMDSINCGKRVTRGSIKVCPNGWQPMYPVVPEEKKQVDLSSAQQKVEWVDNTENYKSYRYYPVANRMRKVTAESYKWVDANFKPVLDTKDSGWCAWTARFLLRNTGHEGSNTVSYFANNILASGGKNVYGNSLSGDVWNNGVIMDAKQAPKFIAQPGDLYLYYRTSAEEKQIKTLLKGTLKGGKVTYPNSATPFWHMAVAVATSTEPHIPYRLEGNRGGRDNGGFGYLQIRQIDSYYVNYVVIRPNWK